MGKYYLVETDGQGHINKATMKLLFVRVGSEELHLVCQHDSLSHLEREMEKICNARLKEFRKYQKEPEQIVFEIRSGLGNRFIKCQYKYYEEG